MRALDILAWNNTVRVAIFATDGFGAGKTDRAALGFQQGLSAVLGGPKEFNRVHCPVKVGLRYTEVRNSDSAF